MKQIIIFVGAVFLIPSILGCGEYQTASLPQPAPRVSVTGWAEYSANPVIKYADAQSNILWNDPSVIKEGEQYRMWLSGGNPRSNPIAVSVYEARSTDGIRWNINTKPALEPAKDAKAWDNMRIETPSVIKVGDLYHLYYSGCSKPCADGVYSIGHATSRDGVAWVKDSRNPVITHQPNPLEWGFYTAAEPGVVYHPGNKKFYLYYASAKSNHPAPGAPFGILLATSSDGSTFTHHTNKKGEREPVHTLSKSYDASRYRGYSTPMVHLRDGVFHMYHTVVFDPKSFQNAALAHATSTDGTRFVEAEKDIFTFGHGDWKHEAVLAPTVIDDGGILKMWFAGQNKKFGGQSTFSYGIGYAVKKR